ncbi:MAG: hypothetical protein HY590_02545 [Candidatus Omnitrophica bacterium]|nr:hypothetical protein [Candidatus Omnitrophota bacterium]
MYQSVLKAFILFSVVTFMTWGLALADEEHHAASQKEEGMAGLTGEVVDVLCYMSHGKEGLGPKHADCAKKCILGGLPVAIRSNDQLYLATMSDHSPANQTLANFAGKEVTVHGKVTEQDGMKFIAVEHIGVR